MTDTQPRLFYRKEKLSGACWEYEISGGWLTVNDGIHDRSLLRHVFRFYRPREATIKSVHGRESVRRSHAEQWFFPDRWFSLLRFATEDDRSIGYYVNFSLPLQTIRENYYSDTDLELDLWLDLDGTLTELDRDEYQAEIDADRLSKAWAAEVERAAVSVREALQRTRTELGPDVEATRDSQFGIPAFILWA